MKLSVYIHFPFCVKRCNYCDFNTYAGKENLITDYVKAIKKEIQKISQKLDEHFQVHTVYFGGGTPSILDALEIKNIIEEVRESLDTISDPEITLEANPGTINPGRLEESRASGINRLSFGVQSFQTQELKLLGRIHSAEEAEEAFQQARNAGFRNINLDLIYGLPNQTLKNWKDSLSKAVRLNPTHLSLYSLTIEAGTNLDTQIRCGNLPEPDNDLMADMYEWAMDYLEKAGYRQYEISNWGRAEEDDKSWFSRHNMQYWLNGPYLGIGAGAHSFIMGKRTENVKEIEAYLFRLNQVAIDEQLVSPANEKITQISKWDEIQETMMLGLRLTEQGVNEKEFTMRFGRNMDVFFPKQIDSLTRQGLLEWGNFKGDRALRLTRKGRLLGNRVFSEFVGNPAPMGLR